MRLAARQDDNHKAIRSTFERLGCLVQDLSGVGKGVPDLLVWIASQRVLVLVEVKDGSKSKSAQSLTSDQVTFHNKWLGRNAPVCVVRSMDDVVKLVNSGDWSNLRGL